MSEGKIKYFDIDLEWLKKDLSTPKTVEDYISQYTRRCSNELCYEEGLGKLYEPWLTPDQARAIAELARRSAIDDARDWFAENFDVYMINGKQDELIPDLIKYMEDK